MLADGYCCCLLCVIDPFAHYTHWKQTVFYMDDFITVKKGEEVNGVFHLKPNERNIVCTAVSVFAVAVVFFYEFSVHGSIFGICCHQFVRRTVARARRSSSEANTLVKTDGFCCIISVLLPTCHCKLF